MIPKGKFILSFTRNKIREAKENIDITVSNSILYNMLSFQKETWNKIWSEGKVKTRLITERTDPTGSMIKKLNQIKEKGNLDFRFCTSEEAAVYLSVYDSREVVIRSKLKGQFLETGLYWSNNPCFVTLAKVYFDDLWEKSKSH